METITISGIYNEFGISHALAKKLIHGLKPVATQHSTQFYDKKQVKSRVLPIKNMPTNPPEGYASLTEIAKIIGIHKRKLYLAERENKLKPAGLYKGKNSCTFRYFSIQEAADFFAKPISDDIDFVSQKIIPFGALPKQEKEHIILLTRAFNLAQQAASH